MIIRRDKIRRKKKHFNFWIEIEVCQRGKKQLIFLQKMYPIGQSEIVCVLCCSLLAICCSLLGLIHALAVSNSR